MGECASERKAGADPYSYEGCFRAESSAQPSSDEYEDCGLAKRTSESVCEAGGKSRWLPVSPSPVRSNEHARGDCVGLVLSSKSESKDWTDGLYVSESQ